MKRNYFVAAVLTASLLLPGAAAGALGHPDHEQKNRGNGPAEVENGADRGNPNGSNGTIKLDGVEVDDSFDAHPNNEPHIGCQFEVDLYGLDEGDTAILEFREWAPTAEMEPIYSVTTEDDDVLGEDGAGGGVDIDDEQLIDLAPHLVGEPHPVHGHHVRLDAIITSGDNEYKKTKVFWTGTCESSGSGSGS